MIAPKKGTPKLSGFLMNNHHSLACTTHTLKNYVDQVLNGAINYYNSALTTVYNRIATLEAEATYLWGVSI